MRHVQSSPAGALDGGFFLLLQALDSFGVGGDL
jgi:hypothetical protein